MRSRSGFEPADESFAFLTFHLNISNASYLCYRIVNPKTESSVKVEPKAGQSLLPAWTARGRRGM